MTKRKRGIFLFLMAFAMIFTSAFAISSVQTVNASTYYSGKYKTSGSYSTGSGYTSGSPSNFSIYMYSSNQNGTTGIIYNDKVLNWNYVNIRIEVSAMTSHSSFKLYKNDYLTISNKSLSGNASQTLYSGSLTDGSYELIYTGTYKKNIFTGTTTFTYKYKFVIDTTGPTYTLKAGANAVSSGSYTNQQITYSVKDYKTWVIYYKKPGYSSFNTNYTDIYTVAATEANNGWWYFYAEDYYDNTNSVVSIHLDTVAPVGYVRADGLIVADGGYTSKPFSYSATDKGGVSYYEYKRPGSSSWQVYKENSVISGTYGEYKFRAVDKAKNTSKEYTVYYDAGKPSGTLYGGTTVKSSGSYTNASYVKYVCSDGNSGIASCYVKMPGSSYYTSYASGMQLTAQGTYYFYSINKAGTKSAVVSITLDSVAPYGYIYAGNTVLRSGSSTNADSIRFEPYDAIGLEAVYVKLPSATEYSRYTIGTEYTAQGMYSFYARDKSGNISSVYTVTISRTIPVAKLYVDDVTVGNNSYTNGAHIKFECSVKCYVKLPNESNFSDYLSGVEYHKPGKYVFYGVDTANNSTGYFTIIIDRTVKPLTITNLTNGVTDGDVMLEWTDGDPNIFAPIKTVKINDVIYEKGETIYTIKTGKYNVVCEDAAGNIWKSSFESVKTNVLNATLQQEYFEAYDVRGNYFAFAGYNSAFAFAMLREKSYVRQGEWINESWDTGIAMDAKDSVNAKNGTFYIYKKSGEGDKEVAYFTEARLNEVMKEYAAKGIKSYFYWEKNPAEISGGEDLYPYVKEFTLLSDKLVLCDNVGAKIDGEIFVGTKYTGEGEHTLTVYDKWGNECDYTIRIVRSVPDVYYTVNNGKENHVTFDRVYYMKDVITVKIADNLDEFAMFNVFDESGELIGCFRKDEEYAFAESGRYSVVALNHFGESEPFEIIISKFAPEVFMKKDAVNKKLEITINESVDKDSHIQMLELYKSVDGGKTWTLIEKDDYGSAITLGSNVYYFRTSGEFKVILADEFRTGIDAVTARIVYKQPAPDGLLIGVEDGAATNGSVSFVWSDEARISLEKEMEVMPLSGDGAAKGKKWMDVIDYKSGESLTEDGTYVLTFENFDGYKVIYTFIIDTSAPELVLDGAEDLAVVNQDVAVFLTEEGIKCEIFKDGASLGEYVSGTVISESGKYRIVATDEAGNVSVVAFTIDKIVDFDINVCEKGIANSVNLTANEELTVTLLKNAERVEYVIGDSISEVGKYSMYIEDKLGNHRTIEFDILESLVRKFEYNFDDVPGFEKALVNGVEKRLNYGTLELFDDGDYVINVIVKGTAYPFSVTVDATPPTITLNGVENGGETKGEVTISETSEDAAVEVLLNGETIKYTSGQSLSVAGKYTVKVTDKCGNVSEYNFEILKTTNKSVVAMFAIGGVAILIVAVFFILKKKKVF